jgi:hypothetical protein
MRQNKIADALNPRSRQRALIPGRFHDRAQRDDDMPLTVIEKHTAERLTSVGSQRTGGLVALGDRIGGICSRSLLVAHHLRCNQV